MGTDSAHITTVRVVQQRGFEILHGPDGVLTALQDAIVAT